MDPSSAEPSPGATAPRTSSAQTAGYGGGWWGGPRSVEDPGVFHHISLVAFLAWVGLGADGLSSSSYGPEEAFRALGQHMSLAPLPRRWPRRSPSSIISAAYSRIIEHFPFGGGGYVVATRLLGPGAGVVSGAR